MSKSQQSNTPPPPPSAGRRQEDDAASARPKAKFEVYGEEMIEKVVKPSGNSGRVYLPPEWIGRNVKIIRID